MVLHRCDVKRCCNPEHLFLGTQVDNMRDMVAKGRAYHQSGECNGNAKLNERQVRKIKELLKTGLTYREVAVALGVSKMSVWHIQNGTTWKYF